MAFLKVSSKSLFLVVEFVLWATTPQLSSFQILAQLDSKLL